MLSQAFPQPGGESSPVTSVAQGAFLLLIFSSLDGKTINIIIREVNYSLDFWMFIHHPSKFGKFLLKIGGEIICQSWPLLTPFFNFRIVHCVSGWKDFFLYCLLNSNFGLICSISILYYLRYICTLSLMAAHLILHTGFSINILVLSLLSPTLTP